MWTYHFSHSRLHNLHGSVKILIVLIWGTVIFQVPALFLPIPLFLMIIGLISAKLPVKTVFLSLAPFWIILALTGILSVLHLETSMTPSGNSWHIRFSKTDLLSFSVYAAQFNIALLFSLLLISTTSQSRLISGLETLLAPVPGINGHIIALTVMVTLNTIPVIFRTWKNINKAAQLRQLNKGIPVIRSSKLMIPLMIQMVHNIEKMSQAIELRGVTATRTRQKQRSYHCERWRTGEWIYFTLMTAPFLLLPLF